MRETPVTIIVTGRNSETTILPCLDSLSTQDWPIDEIIVFDNGSTDGTRTIVLDFIKRSPVPIRLVDGGTAGFICSAFNKGVAMSKTQIVVLCHSDGMTPTSSELRKLVKPLMEDEQVVAAYPRNLMPREVWDKFSFWQKFLFVRAVGSTAHAVCAIFDAIRKSAFVQIGGFNECRFVAGCGYGGEDSDFWRRISACGKLALTDACAVHIHGFSPSFGWRDYLSTRKLMARTYGKVLHFQRGFYCLGDLAFFIRPVLSLLPFMALAGLLLSPLVCLEMLVVAIAVQIVFSVWNGRKMFSCRECRQDARIWLVVPAGVLMIYYETFWFCEGIVTPGVDEKTAK